ncbi:MAG: hypothetical protein ABIO65_01835 [Nitrospiria bacterium]
MAKTVTIRIDEATYREFAKRAKAQNRPLSNFITTAVKERIQEADFADDSEMADILGNAPLLSRLKKGSGEVRKRKGTMIG